jgi:cyanophycinase
VAIDAHVIRRGWERDLAQAVAARPGLLGIGIDEQAAVVVRRNTMTVLGNSVVLITDGASHNAKPYYVLTSGTRFDLATWTVLPA